MSKECELQACGSGSSKASEPVRPEERTERSDEARGEAPPGDGKEDPAVEPSEEERQEGRSVKGMRGPVKPTKAEKEDHERDHIPFRSWCAHCMRGKTKASGHRGEGDQERREKPIVSMDYAFLGIKKGKDKEERKKLEEEAMKAGNTPTLVMFDAEAKGIFTYVVDKKGADDRVCRRVVTDLDNLGYKEIVLKGDQEPALASLMAVIKANWDGDAAMENSPVRESEGNGAVERAIQTWEGQVRTMKDALESRIGEEISPDHVVMTWLAEYAATLLRRCLVSSDGRTPYEKMKGRPSRRPVAEFGEKVWYRPLHGKPRTSLDPVMNEGIFVGVLDRSDEVLVAVKGCRQMPRPEKTAGGEQMGPRAGDGDKSDAHGTDGRRSRHASEDLDCPWVEQRGGAEASDGGDSANSEKMQADKGRLRNTWNDHWLWGVQCPHQAIVKGTAPLRQVSKEDRGRTEEDAGGESEVGAGRAPNRNINS
jgi:hypothetical protein